jgi:hypothetical protein
MRNPILRLGLCSKRTNLFRCVQMAKAPAANSRDQSCLEDTSDAAAAIAGHQRFHGGEITIFFEHGSADCAGPGSRKADLRTPPIGPAFL